MRTDIATFARPRHKLRQRGSSSWKAPHPYVNRIPELGDSDSTPRGLDPTGFSHLPRRQCFHMGSHLLGGQKTWALEDWILTPPDLNDDLGHGLQNKGRKRRNRHAKGMRKFCGDGIVIIMLDKTKEKLWISKHFHLKRALVVVIQRNKTVISRGCLWGVLATRKNLWPAYRRIKARNNATRRKQAIN